jgi:hypothetical protein
MLAYKQSAKQTEQDDYDLQCIIFLVSSRLRRSPSFPSLLQKEGERRRREKWCTEMVEKSKTKHTLREKRPSALANSFWDLPYR